jgi:hypothetical protein
LKISDTTYVSFIPGILTVLSANIRLNPTRNNGMEKLAYESGVSLHRHRYYDLDLF